MKSTVVGSFPVKKSSSPNFKDRLLNALGAYDSFKEAIKSSVIAQLDAGVDIISDSLCGIVPCNDFLRTLVWLAGLRSWRNCDDASVGCRGLCIDICDLLSDRSEAGG